MTRGFMSLGLRGHGSIVGTAHGIAVLARGAWQDVLGFFGEPLSELWDVCFSFILNLWRPRGGLTSFTSVSTSL